jgi:hypothetical protein
LILSVDHIERWETEMMGCPTSYPATIGRRLLSILRAKYRFSALLADLGSGVVTGTGPPILGAAKQRGTPRGVTEK